jgi:hypothetical protein
MPFLQTSMTNLVLTKSSWPKRHTVACAAVIFDYLCVYNSERLLFCKSRVHCRKSWRFFFSPRIFPSYFMKILQKIFRKNVLRNISWNFSKSNSNFSDFPHSLIYVWWKILRFIRKIVCWHSSALLIPNYIDVSIVQWLCYSPPKQMDAGSNLTCYGFFFGARISRNIPKYISNN